MLGGGRDLGFWLDVRRLFVRRASANVRSLLFENVLQPVAVAIVVVLAFVNRTEPFNFARTFVYFSGLYAFWIGLFGSCQSVNSELRNGEWSYWILGLGRNRAVHLLAIFAVNTVFAAVQLTTFVGTIAAFRLLSDCSTTVGLESVYRDVVNFFVSSTGEMSPLFQMQGLLKLYLEHLLPGWGSDLFAFAIFGFSLSAAMVSGVGFGLLCSTVFRDPVVSLNISVGFVVIIGMISHVSLNDAEGDERKAVDRAFALSLVQELNPEAGSPKLKNLLDVLTGVSRFLPQRYFYNMGTMTFDGSSFAYEDAKGRRRHVFEPVVDRTFPAAGRPGWLRPACRGECASLASDNSGWWLLQLPDAQTYRALLEAAERERPPAGNSLTYRNDFALKMETVQRAFSLQADADPGYLSSFRFGEHFILLGRALWAELKWLLVQLFACLGLSLLLLYRKEAFHVLR